jgi:hypothetical protein
VKRTIAIQVGAISFIDEGVDKVLDQFQEKAGINNLFLASHTFDRGTGGRQIPGYPIPDHGKQEYDLGFRGGNFATIHPQYYQNTFIRDFAAPEADTAGWDILEKVIPAAKKRGIDVFCWMCENPFAPLPRLMANFALVSEIDPWGRKTGTPCFRNPAYRNWHLGIFEDTVKSYPIQGIAFCSERQGPLGQLFGGGWNTRGVGCFCPHCAERMHREGINVERARAGYKELAGFFDAARKGSRPTDGYFVTFWRLLLKYPEILAVEEFWTTGLKEMYAELYGTVKAITNEVKVGWHVMHLQSFSPFYRAEADLAELADYSDFIKSVMYHNCAGTRYQRFVEALHQTIFRDAQPEESYKFLYRILNIDEAQWKDLPAAGFSADYVARETRRSVAAVAGRCEIWPGIEIDIPEKGSRDESPADVKGAVLAAFRSGAQGVVLSRKYSEMRLRNLAAVGDALKELGG